MFSASVTRQTLPVRSPLPNKVPSTRSAPASRASSADATAVPRSLCGCTDRTTASRRSRLRCIHSTWSAKTCGEWVSTVVGRFSVSGRSAVAPTTSATRLAISSASSGSVRLKVSGEYSKRMSVPGSRSASRTRCWAPSTAMPTTSRADMPNTTSRHRHAVA